MSARKTDITYLASFPELNPQPVFETDELGNLRYANKATKKAFPDIERLGLKHPMLAGLGDLAKKEPASPSIERIVDIKGRSYRQTIHRIKEYDSLRSYCLDVTDSLAFERLSLKREKHAVALAKFAVFMLGNHDLDSVLNEAVKITASELGVEMVKVLELEDDRRHLVIRAGTGWKKGVVGKTRVPSGCESQAGYTIMTQAPVIVTNLSAETRFTGPALLLDHKVVSGLSLIIGEPNRLFGVLGAHSTKPHDFSKEDIEFMTSIANALAKAVEVKRITNRREHKQDAIAAISLNALQSNDMDELYAIACREVAKALSVKYVSIFRHNIKDHYCVLRASVGYETAVVDLMTAISEPCQVVGCAIEAGKAKVIENADKDSGCPIPPAFRDMGMQSGGIAIVGKTERPYGVLCAHSEHPFGVEQDDVGFLQAVANVLYLAHLRKHTLEELDAGRDKMWRATEGIIGAISKIVETRDPYTAGHETKVGVLARAIAQEMGLDEDTSEGVYYAGLIHDIGKLYVPAEILSKPGRITALEFEMVKAHPSAGYEILKFVDFPWPISLMVQQHHERIDGSGYPDGIKGADISVEAKILAVADVVEAMTSHRPYRPKLGIEVALDEISQNRGTLFDSAVVDACVKLFTEKGFTLE